MHNFWTLKFIEHKYEIEIDGERDIEIWYELHEVYLDELGNIESMSEEIYKMQVNDTRQLNVEFERIQQASRENYLIIDEYGMLRDSGNKIPNE